MKKGSSFFSHSNIFFDAGGARFNTQQYRILKLINELGLDSKKKPIQGESQYISIEPNYDIHLEKVFPEMLLFWIEM